MSLQSIITRLKEKIAIAKHTDEKETFSQASWEKGTGILLSVSEAQSLLSHLEAEKWVSVEERLPDREVLAINKANDYLIGYVAMPGFFAKFICTSDSETLEHVTHWMPLPLPPKP